jgi:rRNA maturation endonuclease Nob1
MGGIICSLAFLALLAGGAMLVRRKRERESWYYTSRCTGCGYDLRNSVSDRCPECGKPWWHK